MAEIDLSKRAESGSFFEEPIGPEPNLYSNTPAIEKIQSGQSKYHQLARAKLNAWLKVWDFGDLSELVPRLTSRFSSQHEGAVWELFLNAMFRHLGFSVTRDPLGIQGKTPDFFVQGNGIEFYVEATCVPSGAQSTQEKNWLDLVSKVETLERDDFFISLLPVQMADESARSSYFNAQIMNFLDGLNYEDSVEWTIDETPTKSISFANWEIEVRAFRRSTREQPTGIIGMRGVGSNGAIPDLENLKGKIHQKRKRYGQLMHPYLIAILENSFFAGGDEWHRFGALFGQMTVVLHDNGSSEMVRRPDGIWNEITGEKNLEGLLLCSKMQLWDVELELPELWTNPNLPESDVRDKLMLSRFMLVGGKYGRTGPPLTWNGL